MRDLPGLARALEAKARRRFSRARLVNTYFDTPEQTLARHGLALRVRERNGRFVQTVKSAEPNGDGGNGVAGLVRGEWEDAIGGNAPDPQAPQTGRFIAPDVAPRLAPLFRTEVDRRTIDVFPDPDTHIEAAVDRGRIVAPGLAASEPISEVELELKSGCPAALYEVALDLLAVAPVRLWGESKAERGYRLATMETPVATAVHAAAVPLDATLSGDEALRRIGLACLDQLMRNEPSVLAGDAEGIHQMRVAARRLRAILSAFRKLLPDDQRRLASDELRWLAGTLGTARNLDVFASTILAPAKGAAVDASGLAALAAAAEQRRVAAYAKAKRAVSSTRYTALLLRQLAWFESCGWRGDPASEGLRQPIGGTAGDILERRRRAAKRRSRHFAGQSAGERHKLRIALKKLRYATELLAGLYDTDAVADFIKRLKRLQDDLGDANDLRVAHDIIDELAGPRRRNPTVAEAGGAVLRWHETRLARREPGLRQHLDRLLAAEPFWAG